MDNFPLIKNPTTFLIKLNIELKLIYSIKILFRSQKSSDLSGSGWPGGFPSAISDVENPSSHSLLVIIIVISTYLVHFRNLITLYTERR